MKKFKHSYKKQHWDTRDRHGCIRVLYYNEIVRLSRMLEAAEIPYVMAEYMDGYRLVHPFPHRDDTVEVTEHMLSKGSHLDRLTISYDDTTATGLSAEEAFQIIRDRWEASHERRC